MNLKRGLDMSLSKWTSGALVALVAGLKLCSASYKKEIESLKLTCGLWKTRYIKAMKQFK